QADVERAQVVDLGLRAPGQRGRLDAGKGRALHTHQLQPDVEPARHVAHGLRDHLKVADGARTPRPADADAAVPVPLFLRPVEVAVHDARYLPHVRAEAGGKGGVVARVDDHHPAQAAYAPDLAEELEVGEPA